MQVDYDFSSRKQIEVDGFRPDETAAAGKVEVEPDDLSEEIVQDIEWASSQIADLQRINFAKSAALWPLLKRIILTRFLYKLSNSNFLNEKRRKKYFRSAQKRDPMLLSERLDQFCVEYFSRISKNRFLGRNAANRVARFGVNVTAIVPSYNHAPYLKQRLDSILKQTYPLIDIIILDDCSSDDSREIIQSYTNRYPERIRAVFNDVNSGNVFRQWHKGHAMARGDIIWICESDDFCEPNFVERAISAFRDPSVMLAFGRIQFADSEGRYIPGLDHYREEAEPGIWGQSVVRPAARWFKGGFGVKNVIANVGGSLWRRTSLPDEVWEEASSYKVMGDWFLYSALAQGGQIAYEPSAVAYFRTHGQNTSGASTQSTPEYYIEYRRLMEALKRRWSLPTQTVDRFLENCRSIYRGAGIKSPPFDALLPEACLKVVQPEIPHVLIGLLGFSFGGGEIFPIHLANALHRRGAMVSILQMMDTEDHPDVRSMLNPSIPVYTANAVRDWGSQNFLADAGVSIVHSHIAAVEMLLLDERKMKTPYLATLHGSYEATQISKRKVSAWAERVDQYVFTADRNLSVFEGLGLDEDKFLKFRNAMPLDDKPFEKTRAELGVAENAVVFTLVARGIEGKGWLEAVDAFQRLRLRHPELPMALLAVGEGPYVDKARARAGQDSSIHFLGYAKAIHGIYRMSDVALVPTRYAGESFPLCLIQAMQAGIPSIATDIGEIRAMLNPDDRQAGLMVPNVSDDETFVQRLMEMMQRSLDPHLRRQLGADAVSLGEVYSIDALAGDYLDLYRSIIARSSTQKKGMPFWWRRA